MTQRPTQAEVINLVQHFRPDFPDGAIVRALHIHDDVRESIEAEWRIAAQVTESLKHLSEAIEALHAEIHGLAR